MALVAPVSPDGGKLDITDLPADLKGSVVVPKLDSVPAAEPRPAASAAASVAFTLEVDVTGDGTWALYQKITVPAGGYVCHVFPHEFQANWIRATVDQDCVATAFFHYSGPGHDPQDSADLFAAVATGQDDQVVAGLIRPGKDNRNLQYLAQCVAEDGQVSEAYYEVDEQMVFTRPDPGRAGRSAADRRGPP